MALAALIDRLVTFTPRGGHVASLYLDLRPDTHGRDHFQAFLDREGAERVRTYPAGSSDGEALTRDVARMAEWLRTELRPESHGAALFSCQTPPLFEALQVEAAFPRHLLAVARRPYLYPLLALDHAWPRYAVLMIDAHAARVLVVGLGHGERRETLDFGASRHHSRGGWAALAQSRFQRHAEQLTIHHVREAVAVLTRIARDEHVHAVVLAGDRVDLVPMARRALPADLAPLAVEMPGLAMKMPDHEVIEATLAYLRAQESADDRTRIASVLDEYRSDGLAVVGPDATRRALERGQVDELFVVDAAGTGTAPGDDVWEAEALVRAASATDARVVVVDDPALLAGAGGVAARLRFRG